MKKAILFITSLLFLGDFCLVQAQTFSKKKAWAQEFSGLRKKTLDGWDIYNGPYSTTIIYYTDSIGNLYSKGGYLHLIATADKRGDKVCSAARVSTQGYKSFLYGKLEVRAKTPTGKGIFPAIWMLREDHGDVFPLGEIDIMEYIECFEGKEYCTTTHIVEKDPGKDEIRHIHSKNVKANMKKFHIYGLEWTPTQLRFLLDRKEVYELNKSDAEFWPFDAPYILILNIAYGSWGAKCGMDESIFPKEMLIDWIRYYPLLK